MIKDRIKTLICKFLSLTAIVWMVVTFLYIVYVFPSQGIPGEYLFFTTGILGIKIGSDRVKDKIGGNQNGVN